MNKPLDPTPKTLPELQAEVEHLVEDMKTLRHEVTAVQDIFRQCACFGTNDGLQGVENGTD